MVVKIHFVFLQCANGLSTFVVNSSSGRGADDFDYFIHVFINVGDLSSRPFLGRFAEMKEESPGPYFDIAQVLKIGDDVNEAIRKQVADLSRMSQHWLIRSPKNRTFFAIGLTSYVFVFHSI